MVGMARKNENSAAARLSAPSSIAPTMVAPERDTPGIMARHWNSPICDVHRQREARRVVLGASSFSSSTTSSTSPPAISVHADEQRVEQHVLDEAVQEHPDHGRRQEGEDDAEDEAAGVRIARAAPRAIFHSRLK